MIKTRVKFSNLGSDQPIFSLLGAEDLLPFAPEQCKAFNQKKHDANSKAAIPDNIKYIEDLIMKKRQAYQDSAVFPAIIARRRRVTF